MVAKPLEIKEVFYQINTLLHENYEEVSSCKTLVGLIKYSIRSLISVFNTWVMWSHQMILLDKAHQDVHKNRGILPSMESQVRYISKDLMQAHQKSVEA
jgi:hypothetical protein